MEGVEIVIKPIHLERVIYSIIIIVLVVLLITHWDGGSCDPDKEADAKANTLTGAGLNQTNQTANVSAAAQPASLCANSIKDQDETDVDCGGTTCTKCDDGKLCIANKDCENNYCHMGIRCQTPTCTDGFKNQNEAQVDCGGVCGGYWYDGECNDEPKPQYSGKVEISGIKVTKGVNPSSGYARITNITFSVLNGKVEDISVTAYVYLEDSSGSNYQGEDRETGEPIPFYTEELPLLALGEDYTVEVNKPFTLTATETNDRYSVVVELLDVDDKLLDTDTWTNTGT
jgi:hypothetical protein